MNQETNHAAVKLPLWRKIGYGFGELGSQCSWTLISSYLTVFYTDVAGLAPAVISVIMLLASVNDPVFGSIAENTKTRWGRFRPYILCGAPVLALFNCLTFLNLNIPGIWKIVWCGFTYIVCGMAYTAVNLSVGCLANSMTALNTERVSLNACRGIMGGIIQIIISAVTMPMILHFGNGSTSSGRGYFMAAAVFSAVCIPCFWICFASTKEIIGADMKKEEDAQKSGFVKSLASSLSRTFKDHNAVMMITAMFLFLTGVFGRGGITAYYFIYVLKDARLTAAFAAAMSAGTLAANIYAPFLLNRIDKKKVGALSCICQAACCVLFFIIGETGFGAAAAAAGFLYGVTNLCSLVSNSLAAEVIDDNWLRTGVRSDGVIYSSISFSAKMGNAIGGSAGILALSAAGFVANTQMPDEVLTRMNAVINFGPAVLFVLSAFFFTRVDMTNKRARENEKMIAGKMG